MEGHNILLRLDVKHCQRVAGAISEVMVGYAQQTEE
jgi:hypothetical protein